MLVHEHKSLRNEVLIAIAVRVAPKRFQKTLLEMIQTLLKSLENMWRCYSVHIATTGHYVKLLPYII